MRFECLFQHYFIIDCKYFLSIEKKTMLSAVRLVGVLKNFIQIEFGQELKKAFEVLFTYNKIHRNIKIIKKNV